MTDQIPGACDITHPPEPLSLKSNAGLGAWLPIATAPRDGSRVLAWRRSWDEPAFVRWFLNPRTRTEFWNDEKELDAYENEQEPPTHWMPLPAPPESA